MKAGDEIVVLYAVVPKEKYNRVQIPDGSFAKAFQVGPIEEFISKKVCIATGNMLSVALNRLARKHCPELVPTLIEMPEGHPI